MKKLFAIALIALMPVTSVSADDDGDKEKPKKEKKICRSEKVTGSLTRVRRTCMTQAEWDELAAATKRGLDDLAGDAAGGKLCPADPQAGC